MPDDDLRTMVHELRASIAVDLEAQHRRLDDVSDEILRRIGTSETAIVDELRDLGGRLDRRLVRIEGLLGELDARS